jgi:hypothetical protein
MFRKNYQPTGFAFPTVKRLAMFSIAVLAFILASARPLSASQSETWILIDISEASLSVMQGERILRSFPNISIGRGGTSSEKARDDGKTPLGEFHVIRVSTNTPFRRFFGLDYPGVERAAKALINGNIDRSRYQEIRRAIHNQQLPPQDTVLGGYIGIHGLGKADAAIHEDFNWTYGCIALTNAQIDDLSEWIRLGTKVVIRD